MKLYLSSYRLGDEPQKLADLAGKNRRIAIIANALDVYPDKVRRADSENKQVEALKELGLEPEVLDLRNYFGKASELGIKMQQFGMAWVIGGNAYVLRSAMQQSGLDSILQEWATNPDMQDFVYAGFSAGVCVLQPSLAGIDLVDDPSAVHGAYGCNPIVSGLGILKWSFAPHYKSPHAESDLIEQVIQFYNQNNIPYKALRDGEVIITETIS